MKKLKVGITLDSCLTTTYVKDLIESGLTNEYYQFTHIFLFDKINETFVQKLQRNFKRKGGFSLLLNSIIFRIIIRIELFFINRNRLSNKQALIDVSIYGLNILRLKPIKSLSGYVYDFSKEDQELISKTGIDVLVRGGSGILKGGILNAAPFGILSFHHGDNRINRGGPAGFWECYFGADQTGFIIQRLTNMLDGGIVLKRGNFETQWCFSLNQAYILEKSNDFLKQLLVDLARSGKLKPEKSELNIYSNKLYTIPSWHISIHYFLIIITRVFKKIINRIFSIEQVWSVSFVNSDVTNLEMRKGVKIKNPYNAFMADPFIVERNGKTVCFVEEYSYKEGKGFISAIELDKRSYHHIGSVIKESFHLSFPFVFEFEGDLFMCPETHQNRDIRLYKCAVFPGSWYYYKSIMSNISGADPMIFYYQNKWWLFLNIDRSGGSDHSSELSIFYSDNPIDGIWLPHQGNPVKINSYGGRNGGFFQKDSLYYRVGQNQGFDNYGKGFSIFRIDHLSENNYQEVLVSNIEPLFYNHLIGTHHLYTTGKYTVYDHKSLTTNLFS